KVRDALERRRLKTGHGDFDHCYEYYFGEIPEEPETRRKCNDAFEFLYQQYFNTKNHEQHTLPRTHALLSKSSFFDLTLHSKITDLIATHHQTNKNEEPIKNQQDASEQQSNCESSTSTCLTGQAELAGNDNAHCSKLSDGLPSAVISPKRADDENSITDNVSGTSKGAPRKKPKVCRPKVGRKTATDQ
ncbi:6603_t:CDS:2, partial [Acaulospora morrowiae]